MNSLPIVANEEKTNKQNYCKAKIVLIRWKRSKFSTKRFCNFFATCFVSTESP